MSKKSKILVAVSIFLFALAIFMVYVVFFTDGEVVKHQEDLEEEEEIEIGKIRKNEIKAPTEENIDMEEVEEILTNEVVPQLYIGGGEGVESTDDELVYVGQNPANRNKDQIKKSFANFVVETSDDNTFNISDYSGKPLILLFYRSDVNDAIGNLNVLNQAYEEYGEDVFFACIDVKIDEPNSKEDIQNYLRENDIKIDMFYDSRNNNAVTTYNINYVPSLIFIDKNRNVINTKEGPITYDALEANLDLLLGNF